MDKYNTIKHIVQEETIVNRSKFIATLYPIENEDDALKYLKELRKKYSDATHNVYAYISNSDGTEVRFSDDGEPQGTSAIPILEVLKRKGLVKILAVVTRYFGGIKLGANGLVGAYSSAITNALNEGTIIEFIKCFEYNITYGYAFSNTVDKYLMGIRVLVINSIFENNITKILAIPKSLVDIFEAEITNLLNGNILIELMSKNKYYEIKAKT